MRTAVAASSLAAGVCLTLSGCGGVSLPRPTSHIYRIPSSAMEPTLHCAKPAPGCRGTTDDRVRVEPGKRLERGDIVVFRTPRQAAVKCGEGGIFVKRLIGLPGETVREDDKGFIEINRVRLSEPYVPASSRRSDSVQFGETWHVPKGSYFMIGDNRAASCDSRTWGSLPAGDVIGPVVKILR